MNSGSSGTFDSTDKQNAGQLGNSTGATGQGTSDIDRTQPADKDLDKSGSSTSSNRSLGGDINKSDDTTNLNSDTTSTTQHKKTTTKKTIKRSTAPSNLDNDNSNDLNR